MRYEDLTEEQQRQALYWAFFDYQDYGEARLNDECVLELARSRNYKVQTYTITKEVKVPINERGKKTKKYEMKTVEETVYRLLREQI